ncbi:MAG: lysylphosphatidylglycerol synthase domain-containing protein, partial [Hyphomicrobiales bacterium]
APVRVSPLVRAWLVARLEDLPIGTVLASIALDRIVDGFVFIVFTVVALASVGFPDETGLVREGLIWGSAGSGLVFSMLVAGLLFLRHLARRGAVLPNVLLRWLPDRLARPIETFAILFAQGVAVPRQGWRQGLIIVSSVAMKLLAPLYFVLAGLAFGVVLAPMQYVFIMVFLGFLIILAGTLRIMGSFTVGAVFVLNGFGVGVETALAMAIVVQASSF